eukprot:640854-Alexandrium_andersonii.AAC.1
MPSENAQFVSEKTVHQDFHWNTQFCSSDFDEPECEENAMLVRPDAISSGGEQPHAAVFEDCEVRET